MTKFHFLPFQKRPKINFWTGKTAKNAISRKTIFDLFDFTNFFFAWTFLNFLAHSEFGREKSRLVSSDKPAGISLSYLRVLFDLGAKASKDPEIQSACCEELEKNWYDVILMRVYIFPNRLESGCVVQNNQPWRPPLTPKSELRKNYLGILRGDILVNLVLLSMGHLILFFLSM